MLRYFPCKDYKHKSDNVFSVKNIVEKIEKNSFHEACRKFENLQ